MPLFFQRLDYCNSLYVGLDQRSLRGLQLVQNAAARLLTATKKREHITPVLAPVHWLPVRFRIDFNELYLDVPKCRLKTEGDRAFAVVAPKLWNSLPVVRNSGNV